MNGFVEIKFLSKLNIKAFIGGCYERGVGSKFRAKAHSHAKERIVCFRSDKWIDRPEVLIHEAAHVLTNNCGHTDRWRNKVLEMGGTICAVPGILRSYEKKKRSVKSPNKFLSDLGFIREVQS